MHSHEVILLFLRAAGILLSCFCGILFLAVCCVEFFGGCPHDVQVTEYGADAARVHCICTWSRVYYGDTAAAEADVAGQEHLKCCNPKLKETP